MGKHLLVTMVEAPVDPATLWVVIYFIYSVLLWLHREISTQRDPPTLHTNIFLKPWKWWKLCLDRSEWLKSSSQYTDSGSTDREIKGSSSLQCHPGERKFRRNTSLKQENVETFTGKVLGGGELLVVRQTKKSSELSCCMWTMNPGIFP